MSKNHSVLKHVLIYINIQVRIPILRCIGRRPRMGTYTYGIVGTAIFSVSGRKKRFQRNRSRVGFTVLQVL